MTAKNFIKKRIEKLPEKKARLVAEFLLWLEGEKLTRAELKKVKLGKAEIDRGEYFDWRKIGRAKI